jgi:glucosamine--fructose-6-phosphate aminotransferase (isomerizing)
MGVAVTLRSEIDEQPAVLTRLLTGTSSGVAAAARLLGSADVRHVVIAARGTSDNAARYAKYVWGTRNQLPVTLAAPSVYGAYASPPSLGAAAVVGISQSGQSPDIRSVVAEGKRQGRPTIAITNDVDSPLAELADAVVPMQAGPELSVAATKTYTATLLNIALISTALEGADHSQILGAVPEAVAGVLDETPGIVDAAGAFGATRDCVVLGRGYNYSTAFEWALKLQEMAYVLAHPFSVADFAHGPFALLEPEFPVLAVVADGPLLDSTLAMLDRVRAERDVNLLSITNDRRTPGPTVMVPRVDEWLSPIPAIVAGQIFAMTLAGARGIDPEQPRGLTKVTRTT